MGGLLAHHRRLFVVAAVRFGSSWEADDPRTGSIQRLAIIPMWTGLGLLFWHLTT